MSLGAALASIATPYPPRTRIIDIVAGSLLIGAVGLFGAELTSVLGPPMR
jgi:hypothetical protein